MEIKNKTFSWYVTNTIWTIMSHFLPTKIFLSLKYRLIFGKWIDWKNPKTFTEKLQWLKAYGYGKEEAHLVDKILVKEYVEEKIGKEHVIPTIMTWTSASDIDFSVLPDQFVMKCNHDSGSLVICKDKSCLDMKEAIRKQKKTLRNNYYLMGRETPYRFVARKVLAEKLIVNPSGKELRDYKFFCFNGEPKLFKIDFGRFVNHHANYYDIEKNLLPFGEIWPARVADAKLEFPDCLDDMIIIARKLAEGLPFVRVDLYDNDGLILFGEMTLFPTSGFGGFTDPEWDMRMGSWITLPEKK